MYNKKIILLVLALCYSWTLSAKENIGIPSQPATPNSSVEKVADCDAPTAQIDLNINNVRSRLLTGGDLWWDPVGGQSHYEVPRVPPGSNEVSKNSLFAGALWIGGIDQFDQLKIAAQTYRQSGNDFWPGPLDANGEIEAAVCAQFDKFWEVKGADINSFIGRVEAAKEAAGSSNINIPVSLIPQSILAWPGRNNPYFIEQNGFSIPANKNLAPFWDGDRNPDEYDPTKGDYPVIDSEVEGVFGDQMIWWMFNDKGNVHTETNGEAIGLEVSALAFAFATNDEVNNMTFYKYNVDNKSTFATDSTFFGQWVDPDLGQFDDDYVGCIPEEALGIVYNGDAQDGTYGDSPPMLGIDFFRGPKRTVINDDGEEISEEIGMSAFTYYDNNFTVTGNPENASHFYGYMAGVWKDGQPFTCGGNARGGTELCDYMFPGDPTDGAAWSECSENNPAADRRFLQASGPFRLEPGAVNDIIVGAVWLDKGFQYPCPSFDAIKQADRKAQALFDNNFKLTDGPDAPNIAIRELDQELIISLWNNESTSNNANEAYEEADPILAKQGFEDSTYRFEGYKIYQLSSSTSTALEDPDNARLIAVVDIQNDVTRLINYNSDANIGGVLIPQVMVDPSNGGIRHTFKITNDLFALGSSRLVNNSKYYFTATAYAYNGHTPYDPNVPDETSQRIPYLEGRNNVKVYTGIPHIPTPQSNGITLNAEYGDGPDVIQVSGTGNGGNSLELTQESIDEILANGFAATPTYVGGSTPIEIKIFDPARIPNAEFELTINNVGSETIVDGNSGWTLTNLTSGTSENSTRPISESNEQFAGQWKGDILESSITGFTVNVSQKPEPDRSVDNVVGATVNFSDAQDVWVTLVADDDNTNSIFNWIRSGTSKDENNSVTNDNGWTKTDFHDASQYYETIGGGIIAPYCLTNGNGAPLSSGFRNNSPVAPACTDCYGVNPDPTYTLPQTASVDIVLTAEKTQWTKAVVVEMARDAVLAQGKAAKNGIRRHASWDAQASGNTPSYLSPVTAIEEGHTYYVVGTSAGYIEYQDNVDTTIQVLANNFFKADNVNGSTTANIFNEAELYDAASIGRSWFPGYAINVETGERLNIMFSENSFLGSDNGKDMIWNPSSTLVTTSGASAANASRIGGEHYVYVMNSRYDGGERYRSMLVEAALTNSTSVKKAVYDEAMWVAIPYLTPGFDLVSLENGIVPSSVSMKVRVAKAYKETAESEPLKYRFDFSKFAPAVNQTDVAAKAVDLVKVVPNPYYAFSSYETSSLDNRVRITNLPTRANIDIFTLDGSLVQQIKVDNNGIETGVGGPAGTENTNSVDWDLKNNKNIPVASGVYLIRVSAPDLGEETTIKFFCINRPLDLDIF